MRKEAKIRGIRMVYDDLGAGEVILFIHGQPFNRSMWKDQTDVLNDKYRLIIPDLRGYGESGISGGMVLLDELALDLISLVEQLSIRKAIVVGLSMGGQIALEMYRWAPELFTSIILADTDARAEDANGYLNRLNLAAKIVDDGMEKFTNERIKQFMCANTFANKPAVVAHVEKMMKTTIPEGSAAAQRGRAERPDYTPLLQKIDFPALIIVGDQDVFTPVASAEYMSERIKDSRLVVIKNSGHISNMEQPEAFNQAMIDFFSRLP
jgi:pimeloyl-ACP methyl ester carboxylesterase